MPEACVKLPHASKSVRLRNPALFRNAERRTRTSERGKLRQSSKPLLNKLETAFRDKLKRDNPDHWLAEQAITFRLANGVRYTPDFITFSGLRGYINAYEVKGYMRDDAGVKLKLAAKLFPWVKWVLVWKEKSEWRHQVIMA